MAVIVSDYLYNKSSDKKVLNIDSLLLEGAYMCPSSRSQDDGIAAPRAVGKLRVHGLAEARPDGACLLHLGRRRSVVVACIARLINLSAYCL